MSASIGDAGVLPRARVAHLNKESARQSPAPLLFRFVRDNFSSGDLGWLRDVSEQNLKQAHAAYEQLIDFITKTMDAWMSATLSNPTTVGFKDVQGRAMDLAKENAESAFTFAGKINNAKSYQEIS